MATWDLIWIAVFCGSAAILGWTYAGYSMTLKWLASRLPNSPGPGRGKSEAGSVSIVIAARNESARVGSKVRQLLELHSDLVGQIIIVCDHCTDDTAAVVRAIGDPRVVAIELQEGPAGKAAALNAGVAQATGELVFFNDVRQSLAPDAVDRLAAWFEDPATGAVSGSLEIQASADGSGKGLDSYWNLEKRLRHHESLLDSAIGCTGAIYMIRRSLYQPIPHDTVLDDVVIPMQIAAQGARVLFDPEARAFDPQPLKGAQEAQRKRRTLAGNFQMLFRHPSWLLPWRHRLWFKLISHKYLRILGPVFLAACMAATLCLQSYPAFKVMLALQMVCGVLAVTGLVVPGLRGRVFAFPAAFLLLQWSVVRGFGYWVSMTTRGLQGWK